MEIRNKLEKLFYLVEDSSEKPAGKEREGLLKYHKSLTALRPVCVSIQLSQSPVNMDE